MDRKRAKRIVRNLERLTKVYSKNIAFEIAKDFVGDERIEKHWEEIKAFAEGVKIEEKNLGRWVPVCDPSFKSNVKYRVAKPKIEVNGIEVPAPEYSLVAGNTYFVIDALNDKGYRIRQSVEYSEYHNLKTWNFIYLSKHESDNLVKRGLVYANEADARERARAEFKDLREG